MTEMTDEELEKACEEGAWVLCKYSWEGKRHLGRIVMYNAVTDICDVLVEDGRTAKAFGENLRLATPNDMLKYGE